MIAVLVVHLHNVTKIFQHSASFLVEITADPQLCIRLFLWNKLYCLLTNKSDDDDDNDDDRRQKKLSSSSGLNIPSSRIQKSLFDLHLQCPQLALISCNSPMQRSIPAKIHWHILRNLSLKVTTFFKRKRDQLQQ